MSAEKQDFIRLALDRGPRVLSRKFGYFPPLRIRFIIVKWKLRMAMSHFFGRILEKRS